MLNWQNYTGEECGGGELEDSYDDQYLEGGGQFEEYGLSLLDQADGATGFLFVALFEQLTYCLLLQASSMQTEKLGPEPDVYLRTKHCTS
jgi:hypothetical protein